MDDWTEWRAIVERLSPARRASLLDYARYLASCEEQSQPTTHPNGFAPAEPPPGDDVLDDCRRRGYAGLLGREP